MKRLRFERLQRRLSQHHIARQARIPQPQISLIEIGRLRPTPEQLQRLAVVFNFSNPEDLLREVLPAMSAPEPPQEVTK